MSAAPASGCSRRWPRRLFLISAVVLALMLLLVEGSLALLSYLSLPLLSFPSPPHSPLLLDQLPQFLYLLHNPSTHWLHPRAHSSYWQVQRALPRRGSQVSSQAWKEVLREHIPQKRLQEECQVRGQGQLLLSAHLISNSDAHPLYFSVEAPCLPLCI